MDSANDGEFEDLKEVYEERAETLEIKKGLLIYKNEKEGSTALHLAASKGHYEIV